MSPRNRRSILLAAAVVGAGAVLPGCATLGGPPPIHVGLAGIESLPGEGLEIRFMLKLRVQNRGEVDLSYDGAWVEIELAGQTLASGTAPVAGTVPRYGEVLVTLPVSASGLAIARQAITWMRASRDGGGVGPVAYTLRGGLGGAGLGGARFQSSGEIDLGVK